MWKRMCVWKRTVCVQESVCVSEKNRRRDIACLRVQENERDIVCVRVCVWKWKRESYLKNRLATESISCWIEKKNWQGKYRIRYMLNLIFRLCVQSPIEYFTKQFICCQKEISYIHTILSIISITVLIKFWKMPNVLKE